MPGRHRRHRPLRSPQPRWPRRTWFAARAPVGAVELARLLRGVGSPCGGRPSGRPLRNVPRARRRRRRSPQRSRVDPSRAWPIAARPTPPSATGARPGSPSRWSRPPRAPPPRAALTPTAWHAMGRSRSGAMGRSHSGAPRRCVAHPGDGLSPGTDGARAGTSMPVLGDPGWAVPIPDVGPPRDEGSPACAGGAAPTGARPLRGATSPRPGSRRRGRSHRGSLPSSSPPFNRTWRHLDTPAWRCHSPAPPRGTTPGRHPSVRARSRQMPGSPHSPVPPPPRARAAVRTGARRGTRNRAARAAAVLVEPTRPRSRAPDGRLSPARSGRCARGTRA